MNILLIRPKRIKQSITLGEFMFSEPLGLEMVKSIWGVKHQVHILDLMIDDISIHRAIETYQPHVVGITSLCIDVPSVRALAQQVKKIDPAIIVVVGGTQAYLDPDAFFVDAVDHVFQHTTQANLEMIGDYLQAHTIPPRIDGVFSQAHGFVNTCSSACNEYMIPDRSATATYRPNYSYFGYRPAAIMATSTGCSAHCGFCLRWRIEGPVETYFPMDSVRDDLLSIQEPYVMLYDNDFIHNGERLSAFCDMLEHYQIRKTFICYASVDSILKNETPLRRFASLGLQVVLVGYETFSNVELAAYAKPSRSEDNLIASRLLRSLGLNVWASFIVHPDWTHEDFARLRRFIRQLRPEISTFSPLTPFYHLPMYAAYRDRLLATKEDYEAWSFGQVTIMPSRLSLRSFYMELLKTHVLINFNLNNGWYIVRHFGWSTLLRMLKGSYSLLRQYLTLMRDAPHLENRHGNHDSAQGN